MKPRNVWVRELVAGEPEIGSGLDYSRDFLRVQSPQGSLCSVVVRLVVLWWLGLLVIIMCGGVWVVFRWMVLVLPACLWGVLVILM